MQELNIHEVEGRENIYRHRMTEQEKLKYKMKIFQFTQYSFMGSLFLAKLFTLPTIVPLIAMLYLPKQFLIQPPKQIYISDDNHLKFINSPMQMGLYGATSFCSALVATSFLKLSLGFFPIFLFYGVYLQTLIKQKTLTEYKGLAGIGAINLLMFLENFSSQDPSSLANSLFLCSVGNNLFLFGYTFFVVNQQKVLDFAMKHKALDELNNIFVSAKFQQLEFQQLSWKEKGIIALIVLSIMILQISARNLRAVKKVDFTEKQENVQEQNQNQEKLNQSQILEQLQAKREMLQKQQQQQQHQQQEQQQQQYSDLQKKQNNDSFDNYNKRERAHDDFDYGRAQNSQSNRQFDDFPSRNQEPLKKEEDTQYKKSFSGHYEE